MSPVDWLRQFYSQAWAGLGREPSVVIQRATKIPATIAAPVSNGPLSPRPRTGTSPPGQKPLMPQPMPKIADPPISFISRSVFVGSENSAARTGEFNAAVRHDKFDLPCQDISDLLAAMGRTILGEERLARFDHVQSGGPSRLGRQQSVNRITGVTGRDPGPGARDDHVVCGGLLPEQFGHARPEPHRDGLQRGQGWSLLAALDARQVALVDPDAGGKGIEGEMAAASKRPDALCDGHAPT